MVNELTEKTQLELAAGRRALEKNLAWSIADVQEKKLNDALRHAGSTARVQVHASYSHERRAWLLQAQLYALNESTKTFDWLITTSPEPFEQFPSEFLLAQLMLVS